MTIMYFDRKLRPLTSKQYAELSDDPNYIQVAREELSDKPRVFVSTIWIGFDVGLSFDTPIIFETMLFVDGAETGSARSSTEAEALARHAELVAKGRRLLSERN